MKELTFFDMFAGIGGFRLGMEREGFKCVASCENDEHACIMYKKNFHENPYCDAKQLDPNDLPDFDILCAGFPCQSFSSAGRQKGFDDTRGTLFFDICRVLKVKQPNSFILENVKNLIHHDKGRTFKIMKRTLTELGYTISFKILNAKDFGVPQNRERIIIIGNKDGKIFDFNKLQTNSVSSMKPFLDNKSNFEILDKSEYTLIDDYKRQPKSGLIFIGYRNKELRKKGVRKGTEHLSRVHKQPNRIYSTKGTHPTISSSESSGRYWVYDEGIVRKLTIDECFRFFGFPENFMKFGAKNKLYARIGNSICVNMVQAISKEIKNQFFKD